MIDTIHFRIEGRQNFKMELLESGTEHIKRETGESYTKFKIKNLLISNYNNACTIKGSMARYYLGDNSKTLSLLTFREAVKQLEYDLGIDLMNAKVTRIDIAANFRLTHPIYQYLKYLKQNNYLKICDFNNGRGKLFKNKSRAKNFYDKSITRDENKLRYEYQLKNSKTIRNKLNMPEVTVKNVCSQSTYIKLIELWRNEYYLILRKKKVNHNIEKIRTPTELKLYLAKIGLQYINFTEIVNNSNVELSVKQRYKLKKTIKDLLADEIILKNYKLINELDFKINIKSRFQIIDSISIKSKWH